jgi:hypothetical protein
MDSPLDFNLVSLLIYPKYTVVSIEIFSDSV